MSISAIIPIFNGKKFLRTAIESVIHQTLQPCELILVDDGSTDNSLDVIKDIKADFPIRIVKQQNKGQSSARNHGAKVSKGDFIALLDQDDIWYPDHLEKLYCPLKDESISFAYSNVNQIDDQGKLFRINILDTCGFKHPANNLFSLIQNDMHILPGASLLRKEDFFSIGMFDERLSGYEDDDLFFRFIFNKRKCEYIPESLLKWRIHDNNLGRLPKVFESRWTYTQKIIDSVPPGLVLCNNTPSEILGMRFFNVTWHYYMLALNARDFAKCRRLSKELKKYSALAPKEFRIIANRKLIASNYPKLAKSFLRIRNALR